MVNLVSLQYQVFAKLFKLVLTFGKRYANSSYSVTLYINMGRLIGAENELNELFKSSRELLKQVNFLRLQNVCQVVYCVKVLIRNYHKQKDKERKRKAKEAKDKELTAYNAMSKHAD